MGNWKSTSLDLSCTTYTHPRCVNTRFHDDGALVDFLLYANNWFHWVGEYRETRPRSKLMTASHCIASGKIITLYIGPEKIGYVQLGET